MIGLFCALVLLFLLACNALISIPTGIAPFAEVAATATLEPTPRIKCTGANCAEACIAKLTSVMQGGGPLSPPKVILPHNQLPNAIPLVTYNVQGDQIRSPQFENAIPRNLIPYQQDTSAQQKVWSFFAAIIPRDQRQELTNYIISTDGKGNMLASVEQSANDPAHWALNVDLVDAGNPRSLTYTLVHEFGHMLTLNDTQVTPDEVFMMHPNDPQIYQQEAANCPRFFANNGCSKPSSYINQFFDQFWPKIFDEWSRVNAEKDQANYFNLLGRFYENHHAQFVSPYSATSPEEDIAESWAYFVLTPKPAADSVANQKILFFYGFPELVQLRDQIVYGICNYALDQ